MTQTNDTQSSQSQNSRQKAVVQAVLLFGLVSCFGDIIYEGARSANGQYFSLLSVSAATVGTLYGSGSFWGTRCGSSLGASPTPQGATGR